MSFVLEALKRSEHQRRVATTPTLGSYVLPTRRNGSGPSVRIVAGLLLAALAALAGWWFGTRRPADVPAIPAAATLPTIQQPVSRVDVKPVDAPAPPPTEKTARQAAPDVLFPAPSTRGGGEIRHSPTAAAGRAQTKRAEASGDDAKTVTPPAGLGHASVAQATPAPPLIIALPSLAKAKESSKTEAAVRDGEVIGYADLPASVKSELPSLDLGGYAVGADGQALVAVNDRLLREGDEVASGLVVEKILPDDVIFRYHQYRFRR